MISIGFFLCFIMGVTLGTLGAGGSILILPILIYFFSINPVLATSYSLIIVGITALIGSIQNLISKNIDMKTALKFSISAIFMTYITRRYILPIIPDSIYLFNKPLSKDLFILILFSLLMAFAGYLMIKPKNKKKAIEQLSELNGKAHKLISAFSICYDNQVVYSYVEEVKLNMRKLSKKSIKDYVEIDLPISSCGSYRFEANGKYLFSDVVGNTSTILGLPILPLIKILFKKKCDR